MFLFAPAEGAVGKMPKGICSGWLCIGEYWWKTSARGWLVGACTVVEMNDAEHG